MRRLGAIRCTFVYQGVATRNGATAREFSHARACYELGRKPHRNADSTVGLVPSRSPFAAFLRACLVSNRVGLGGAESAPFTRGTTSREPFLRASFFGFRSISSKENPQRGPPRAPENAKKLKPHLYQTRSKPFLIEFITASKTGPQPNSAIRDSRKFA